MLVIDHLLVQIVVWLRMLAQHEDTVGVEACWVCRAGIVDRLCCSNLAWRHAQSD